MARVCKWNIDELEELKAVFEGGVSAKDLAALHNVSRARIYQLLKQIGVQIRPRKTIDLMAETL